MLTLTCSLHTQCTRHPELRISRHRVAHCGCALANQSVVLSAPRVCECRACALKRKSWLCKIASTPLDNTREVRESVAELEWTRGDMCPVESCHDARCQRAQARVSALEIVLLRAAERASEQAMPRVLLQCQAMRALIASQNTSCDSETVLTAALGRKGVPLSDAANWLHISNSRALQQYRA